jgi:hypothetical protein
VDVATDAYQRQQRGERAPSAQGGGSPATPTQSGSQFVPPEAQAALDRLREANDAHQASLDRLTESVLERLPSHRAQELDDAIQDATRRIEAAAEKHAAALADPKQWSALVVAAYAATTAVAAQVRTVDRILASV